MVRTFKALSALLSYPTDELRQATGEISKAIDAERLIPARAANVWRAAAGRKRAGPTRG